MPAPALDLTTCARALSAHGKETANLAFHAPFIVGWAQITELCLTHMPQAPGDPMKRGGLEMGRLLSSHIKPLSVCPHVIYNHGRPNKIPLVADLLMMHGGPANGRHVPNVHYLQLT